MNQLSASEAKGIIAAIRKIMEEQRDYLIELDGKMGDGDLGLTMSKAFVTADEEISGLDETDPGKLFMKAGMTMAKSAPSTMGTLVATGFMRGGKAVSGAGTVDTAALAQFWAAFSQGLMDRGKAKQGEKTIIDVIAPVAEEVKKASDEGATLSDAAARAEKAAMAGLEATKEMTAEHGRAAYYQEQSVGKEDPGATAGYFIVKGFADFIGS